MRKIIIFWLTPLLLVSCNNSSIKNKKIKETDTLNTTVGQLETASGPINVIDTTKIDSANLYIKLTKISATVNLSENEMKEGLNKVIYYKNWDGSLWKASLENITISTFSGLVINAKDPSFHHDGQTKHKEVYIDYLSDIGEKWRSKCIAQSNLAGEIWFTFEHYRPGQENVDHEDGIMNIQDWEGQRWTVSIDERNYGGNPNAHIVEFRCVKMK